MMKSSIQLSPISSNHLENVGKMFQKLYREEQLTDVTLCCKDGSLRAHKLILATCSPYFHRIFTENTLHGDHPLVIMHGVPFQHLQDLIELIYKGNVEVVPESLDSLYELAREFQLSGISGTLYQDNNENHTQTSSETLKSKEGSHERDQLTDTPIINSIINKTDQKTALSDISKNIEEEEEESRKALELDKKSLSDKEKSPKVNPWAIMNPTFKCELCPSSFMLSSHLTRHQFTHSGARPYACTQCDKAFNRRNNLRQHVRKTHDEKWKLKAQDKKQPTFKCEKCPRSFRWSSHLTRHQLVHMNERSYACPQCNADFSRYDNLLVHLRRYHEGNEDRPTLSGWSNKCEICHISFKKLSHLTHHQLAHMGQSPDLGTQCDKTISRPETLNSHVRKAHQHDNETDYEMEIPAETDISHVGTTPLRECEDSAYSAFVVKNEVNETEHAESKIEIVEHMIQEGDDDLNVSF